MISAQNHLLPLSGNKWLLILCVMVAATSCSPKMQPSVIPQQIDIKKEPIVTAPVSIPPATQTVAVPKSSAISLILPFCVNNLSAGYSATQLTQANIAVDYYQGFKLALDSLTAFGYNYDLHVFDSQGSVARSRSLGADPQIRSSDLIVGPVFPDDLKSFADALPGTGKPIVSPLSATSPTKIRNPNLITVIPPLEYHIRAAAQYAVSKIKPKKIFILSSGFSEENEFINYFKNYVDSLTGKKIPVIKSIVVRGDLSVLIPQFSLTGQNLFVVPSTKQQFLMVTLSALEKLSATYSVTLIGHPNWQKFSFLKAEQLQSLKTYITNADRVDYKVQATNQFLRHYRLLYKTEPNEYSIKGFDEGLYLGKLLAMGDGKIATYLKKTDYTGIHNNFHFISLPGLGWVNTNVNVLSYSDFDLKRVE